MWSVHAALKASYRNFFGGRKKSVEKIYDAALVPKNLYEKSLLFDTPIPHSTEPIPFLAFERLRES